MKFIHMINEKFYKGVKLVPLHRPMDEIYIEFYINPSTKEIRNVLKDSDQTTIRVGVTDTKKPNVFIWRGDILHTEANKHIKFKIGLTYTPSTQKLELYGKDTLTNSKNKEIILNKLQKTFPKVKTIFSLKSFIKFER